MLGKLIKYDIRAGWRDFAGIYMAIILGVLILPFLFKNISNTLVNVIAGFIAAGIVTATIVIIIINLFTIFNTNVFSKAGYLTMTLPVTSRQIVFSKLLVSAMWIVLTGIVSIIGLIIFISMIGEIHVSGIAEAIQDLISTMDGKGFLAVILIVIAVISSIVKEVAKLFLACSVAHLRQLSRFRIPIGILSYFVFSWLEVVVVETLAHVINFFIDSDEIVRQINLIGQGDIHAYFTTFSGVMVFGILYSLALITVYSVGTVWMLNHKLDLD